MIIRSEIVSQEQLPESKQNTKGSGLMPISLLQISLLRFFKKIHKFALCEFMPHALGYFISLVRFFWLFLPNLANANFG